MQSQEPDIASTASASTAPGPAPHPSRDARLDRRAVIALTTIVAVYIGAVAYLASTGRFAFVVKTTIVPALFLVALVTRRFAPFVKDWSVFLGIVVLFDSFRGLVFSLILSFRLPYYAAYVIDWERALLGGKTLPAILQDVFFSGQIGWFEKLLVVLHGSHFVFFLFAGIAVWFFRRDEFWRFKRAFVLLMACGIATYFLVPTVPPWMAAEHYHLIPPIRHISGEVYNFALPSLQQSFDTNPIAAMPSLHAAFPTLCTLVALHHFGRKGILLALYAISVIFAIGYLGEHYLVDILAGVVLAGAIYLLCYRWSSLSRRREPVPQTRWSGMGVQVVIAVLLVLSADGIAEGRQFLGNPNARLHQRPFIEDNLIGRSDLAHFLLANIAFDEGNLPAAIKELKLSVQELKDPGERAHTEMLLQRLREISEQQAAQTPHSAESPAP